MVASGLFRGFLIVSLAPASLGALLAWSEGAPFRVGLFAAVLVCVWSYHVGANLLNEAFDYLSGTDRINLVRTPYSGGTRVLVEGALDPIAVRNVGFAALAVGLAGFLAIASSAGWWLMAFAAVGFFSPILYSVRPFWLAYRGWGELILGLTFGPALAGCAYFALAGTISAGGWVLGASTGLLAAAVILANEFPDREADAAVGKRNLIVRLDPTIGYRLYAVVTIAGAALPIGAVVARWLPIWFLAALLPTALALLTIRAGRDAGDSVERMTKTSAGTIRVYVTSWLVGIAAAFASTVIG